MTIPCLTTQEPARNTVCINQLFALSLIPVAHCCVSGLKSFLLELSCKRQNLSTAPHREDCESFLRAMYSGSQVRALGVLPSKHRLTYTHTCAHLSLGGKGERKAGGEEKEWRGAERSRGQTSL